MRSFLFPSHIARLPLTRPVLTASPTASVTPCQTAAGAVGPPRMHSSWIQSSSTCWLRRQARVRRKSITCPVVISTRTISNRAAELREAASPQLSDMDEWRDMYSTGRIERTRGSESEKRERYRRERRRERARARREENESNFSDMQSGSAREARPFPLCPSLPIALLPGCIAYNSERQWPSRTVPRPRCRSSSSAASSAASGAAAAIAAQLPV